MAEEIEGISPNSFDDAAKDAARKADGKIPPGRRKVRVRLEVTVEAQSPGVIRDYRVILTPSG